MPVQCGAPGPTIDYPAFPGSQRLGALFTGCVWEQPAVRGRGFVAVRLKDVFLIEALGSLAPTDGTPTQGKQTNKTLAHAQVVEPAAKSATMSN